MGRSVLAIRCSAWLGAHIHDAWSRDNPEIELGSKAGISLVGASTEGCRS